MPKISLRIEVNLDKIDDNSIHEVLGEIRNRCRECVEWGKAKGYKLYLITPQRIWLYAQGGEI